jgi:predicted secreted hydrolase
MRALRSLLLSLVVFAQFALATDWRTAEPGWQYDFPRDHHSHPEFKTEWWYFTGNLNDEGGRRFGFEITFFREGIRPLAERAEPVSRFVMNDLKFAHFAITDASGARFRFQQKTSRGSFGEAGFDDANRIAWIEDWSLTLNHDGSFDLAAATKEMSARLHLRAAKSPIVHGQNGVSAKASGEGHASHYYSITWLETTGELRLDSKTHSVTGESWFDHEWATNQLAPEQIGWNWLSVQFSDGSELMLYQMRLKNGGIDPSSSGTFIRRDGTSAYLSATAFRMTPTRTWRSGKTHAQYPIEWRIEIPEQRLQFTVAPVLDDQELALGPLTYWEGAIDVSGTRDGKSLKGRGYLELTGYAEALKALTR